MENELKCPKLPSSRPPPVDNSPPTIVRPGSTNSGSKPLRLFTALLALLVLIVTLILLAQ
jgi:hypothetical protein